MKKTIRKYFWLILCAVLLVVCAVVLVQKKGDPNAGMLPRDLDHEFDHGSGVVVDDATDFQKDSLYKLAQGVGVCEIPPPVRHCGADQLGRGTLPGDAQGAAGGGRGRRQRGPAELAEPVPL
nr:hypothetical protein [uncultured Gemmiger sp.]